MTCPDGSTTPCKSCQVPDCVPVCGDGGWVDSCTGELLKAAECAGCQAVCGAIGTKSEGWYSSCDGLIAWAPCGSGQWECKGSPWELCTKAAERVPEGGYTDPAEDWRTCCPGLVPVEASVVLGGATCDLPGCDCHVCTYCGDGVCKGPENACNCPGDCPPGGGGATGILGPCLTGVECADGLECIGRMDGVGTGVCTREFDQPGTEDAACADAPGSVCAVVPGNGGRRYCSIACTQDAACPSPMQCKVADVDLPGVGTCIEWGWDCEPMDDLYCPPGQQCRIPDGKPACGAAGTLAKGDACEKGPGDACGPGLVCGSLDRCWPSCTSDTWCQDAWGLDFCYVASGGADDWGWCIFLE